MVGSLLLHDIPTPVTLALLPLFIASWWQDWRSARTATSYFSGELVGFDALTAGNYVALVDGWRRPAPQGAWLSTATLISWAGVFAIYVAWNVAVMRKADQATRKAFLRFTLAELPLLAIGIALIAVQTTVGWDIRWLQPVGVGLLAASHAALLVMWRVMSAKED
ncbi:hypothetical protein AQJ66_13580 [Streptomyces bungoensis]|uniref:Uncharacterized protein n=1 Tax=Streptomyces bungoensis TaxID=285568 RepID=A0A101T4H7_9ACTN|nr:hypothetical protein AQJ66_13580 [Streptomyces bungoensis]